ncbi:MAG TPA: DUF2726 domain-containing protein [Mariprofundaceae bacterium]|nr:DUF2726 domain-containing protein [Mariprofundaceae bacterium]
MKSILFMIVIAIACGLLFLLKNKQKSGSLPYVRKGRMFSKAERSFYGVLKQTLGDQYEIFGQVRLADVLGIQTGLSNSERQTAFNKIKAKHVDFVLCNPSDLSFVAAIELDDKSHRQGNRVERDRFMDEAFAAAGLPLIHFKAKATYTGSDITLSLNNALGIKAEQRQTAPAALEIQLSGKEAPAPSGNQAATLCPKCSSAMVRKKATKGKYAGTSFLACSGYPTCKTILPIKAEA